MIFHTYHVKADLWSKECRGDMVRITVFNIRNGKKIVQASKLLPKYSGEAELIFTGEEIRINLASGEGYYVVSDKRHHPQNGSLKMYRDLSGV